MTPPSGSASPGAGSPWSRPGTHARPMRGREGQSTARSLVPSLSRLSSKPPGAPRPSPVPLGPWSPGQCPPGLPSQPSLKLGPLSPSPALTPSVAAHCPQQLWVWETMVPCGKAPCPSRESPAHWLPRGSGKSCREIHPGSLPSCPHPEQCCRQERLCRGAGPGSASQLGSQAHPSDSHPSHSLMGSTLLPRPRPAAPRHAPVHSSAWSAASSRCIQAKA